MRHCHWIFISGCIWLGAGVSLFMKGFALMTASTAAWAQFFMIGALALGFLKGRFVLAKTVKKTSDRIANLSLPLRFSQIYTKAYWALIGSMMGIGVVFRFLPISHEIRGCVDIAIGSALIQGAFLYFLSAWRSHSPKSTYL